MCGILRASARCRGERFSTVCSVRCQLSHRRAIVSLAGRDDGESKRLDSTGVTTLAVAVHCSVYCVSAF
jgi:hypothetical protein